MFLKAMFDAHIFRPILGVGIICYLYRYSFKQERVYYWLLAEDLLLEGQNTSSSKVSLSDAQLPDTAVAGPARRLSSAGSLARYLGDKS